MPEARAQAQDDGEERVHRFVDRIRLGTAVSTVIVVAIALLRSSLRVSSSLPCQRGD
jgi:hypothetical protein